MLSFLPRELFVKPPQITLISAIGPWGRGVMHLISPLGGKGLNTRLFTFSNNHKILHRSQIGFLPGHHASEHIFSLRTLIDNHVSHSPRGKLYTCFVDFKKAFDSIWHQSLLHLLQKNFQHVFPFNMLCERQLYSIRIFQL